MLTCSKVETQTGRALAMTLQVPSSHRERRVPQKGKANFQKQVGGEGRADLTLRWGGGHRADLTLRELVYILLKQPGVEGLS